MILRFGVETTHKETGFPGIVKPLLSNLNLAQERQDFIYTALFMKCPEFSDLKKSYFERLDFILKEVK